MAMTDDPCPICDWFPSGPHELTNDQRMAAHICQMHLEKANDSDGKLQYTKILCACSMVLTAYGPHYNTLCLHTGDEGAARHVRNARLRAVLVNKANAK